MDTVPADQAFKHYAITNYLQKIHETCYDKCVVDFQNKDISTMEKECAKNCLQKHMIIYKEMRDAKWSELWSVSLLLFRNHVPSIKMYELPVMCVWIPNVVASNVGVISQQEPTLI